MRSNSEPKPALGWSEDRLIERKQMSTKTTFKRIALVAVAAMGFGLLSVAPSSAAQHVFQADTFTTSATTSDVAVGSSVSITVTMSYLATTALESMTVTSSFTSTPAGATLAELPSFGGFSAGSNTSGSLIGTGSTSATVGNVATAGYTTGTYTVTFAPVKSGTYVIALTPTGINAAGADTVNSLVSTAKTWTVTVGASTAADTTSTAVMRLGILTTGSASTVDVAVGSTNVAVATIRVTPLTASVATAGSSAITAVITGAGTIGIGASAGATPASAGRSLSSVAAYGASTYFDVAVFNDGTAGTGTITITLGTVTFSKTVTFMGAATSVTSTLVKPIITSGSGATAVETVTAVVKDAAGNGVSGVTLYAVSGTPAVFASASATSGSAGFTTFSFLGLTAGTSTVTVQNVAAGSTATYSAAALSVRAGSNVTSSAVLSLDKATYSQGEAAVLTVTLTDAAGNAVADGTHTPFTAAVSSRALTGTGTLPGDSLITAGSNLGVLTYKINVPNTSGAFTISATAGSGYTGTYSVTATVSQSAAEIANADAIAAAADAAAEATDAANAATDAANAAAEAADAATAAAQDAADAVATLGTQVAELIDGLKAQIAAQKAAITALTNLVIKIQKKLKA